MDQRDIEDQLEGESPFRHWVRKHRTALIATYTATVSLLVIFFAVILIRYYPSSGTTWGILYWVGAFVVLLLASGLGLALGKFT